MNNLYNFMPNLDYDEYAYLNNMLKDYSEDQLRTFSSIYNSRRRDPQIILLCTLVGFLGINGVQRFITDQIGMGILYLLTGGLCMIGTIIDIVNYKKLAFEYNYKVANQVNVIVVGSEFRR